MIKYVNISDQNMKDLLYLRDEQIKDCIQLLLYAYRETFSDPLEILKKNSLGAAHYRALHLVERNEGINVNNADSFLTDHKLAHFNHFKFLPPVNEFPLENEFLLENEFPLENENEFPIDEL